MSDVEQWRTKIATWRTTEIADINIDDLVDLIDNYVAALYEAESLRARVTALELERSNFWKTYKDSETMYQTGAHDER